MFGPDPTRPGALQSLVLGASPVGEDIGFVAMADLFAALGELTVKAGGPLLEVKAGAPD